MGCGASIPPPPPLRKLDAKKFTEVFSKENVTDIVWQNDQKCLLFSEEKLPVEGAPDNPYYRPPIKANVEVYDVKSKEVKMLSSVAVPEQAPNPIFAASSDGKMYSIGAESHAHIFNAEDGSEISKKQLPFALNWVSCMAFSPDSQHIAVAAYSDSKDLVVMTVEGTEVYTAKDQGQQCQIHGHIVWMDNKTVMVASEPGAEIHDISKKALTAKWTGPKKSDIASVGENMLPKSLHVMKSGKAFVSHRDEPWVFLVKKGKGEIFEPDQMIKLSEMGCGLREGPKLAVLADEQTLIYEKINREGVADQLESHVVSSGEKLQLPRTGELAKVQKLSPNSSDTILAVVDQKGAKLYTMGIEEAPPAA